MKYTYVLLNLFTFLPVVLFSFDKKLRFFTKWHYAFPGIFVIAVIFSIWDSYFTEIGIWSFNPNYVLDIRLFHLPLEEYIFFLVTPFACLFIYEAIGVYYRPEWLHRLAKPIGLFLAISMGCVAVRFPDRAYTFVNFGLASLLLLVAILWGRKEMLGQFCLAYMVHLLPFYIVNGVLTSWPVLEYNDAENLGIRVGTIPLEDHAYSLILFFSNFWVFEWFKRKDLTNGVQFADND